MAGRTPKRYEPGELDNTRRHLGEVSEQEARRMAKVLGGEVGVEKSSPEIDEKYRKIGELNRRRRDRFVPPPSRAARNAPSVQATSAAGDISHSDTGGRARASYFDRLRMDFLASRPEHRIKTRSAAFAAIFSMFFTVRDFVNRRFISDADELYFKTIENLVLSVRLLLARYAKSPRAMLRIAYYEEVLTVIKDWDLEALSREIARLQGRPHRLLISECRELCRLIYRPIVRLLDLDPNYHIAQALKHIYDVDLASIPKDSPDVAKIKLAYSMGRDMILRVFIDMKQHLYPLLLKLASVRFSAYSDFFSEQRPNILPFLSLGPSDLMEPKEREKIVAEQKSKGGKPDDVEEKSESGETTGEEEEHGPLAEEGRRGPKVPKEVARGLELLDQLFPQAGFKRINDFPDMYPYFQPLLKLPKGTELIAPEDPLQQIVIIVACLQEIFYGFRSIRFKNMGDDTAGVVLTANKIEAHTVNWHLFLDEIIGKNYVSSLFDYCRQVELGATDLRSSDYTGKLESELMWIKRRFFLRFLSAKIIKGLRPNVATNLPRLPDTVRDLRELLEEVVADAASGEVTSMENPWEDFSFAVEGFLSKRLRHVLSRRANPEEFLNKRISNISLVFHTLLILRTLDYLINDQDCFYISAYDESGQPLFRSDASKDGVPLYNVPVEDPFTLIAQADARAASAPSRSEEKEEQVDRLTHMGTSQAMANKIRGLIETAGEENTFVLLPVTLRKYSEISSQRGVGAAQSWLKKVAVVITTEIRDFEDVPYRVGAGAFIVVMPATNRTGAVHLAERVMKRFREIEHGEIPISIGIVEYRHGWSIERLLKATQAAIREAAKLPSPALVTHEPTTDTFVPHT